MKRNINVYVVCLCFWMIAGVPFCSMAAGIPAPPSRLAIGLPDDLTEPIPPPVPVTPPGNDGLLSRMTPGNYSIPSGWSMVLKQDFEGTLSANEGTNMSFTADKSHTGGKSLVGSYAWDAASVAWFLRKDKIGSFTEVYLSWYEFTESQARFNDEYWLAQFLKRGPNGELYQEVIVDWMWVPNFNSTNSYLYFVPQSAAGGGKSARYGGGQHTVPVGTWTQWEIHYRPNTSGSSNGFIRIYKDGTLWESAENKNLNGAVDMTNMTVQVGGVYTKLTWVLSGGVCASSFGSGTDSGPRVTNFSSCPCPNQCPPEGKVPVFKRYYDDIIILKK